MGKPGREPEGEGKNMIQGIPVSLKSQMLMKEEEETGATKGPQGDE